MTTLLETLEKRDAETERHFFDMNKASFEASEDGKFLNVGDDTFGINAYGMNDLLNLLEIPKPYATRCPDDLLTDTVNYWIRARKDTYSSILTEGDKLRAFMQPEYPYVSTFDVFNAAFEEMGDSIQIPAASSGLGPIVKTTVFSPEFETELAESTIKAGLRFVYSDSWAVFPKFDSYLCRIACLNSAFSPLEKNRFHALGRSKDQILEQVREFVKKSFDQVPVMLDGLRALRELRVENLQATVKNICREHRLPNKVVNQIMLTSTDSQFLDTMPTTKMETMYDVANLLTYVATHNREITDAHRETIFNIAGNLMLHEDHRCEACGGTV